MKNDEYVERLEDTIDKIIRINHTLVNQMVEYSKGLLCNDKEIDTSRLSKKVEDRIEEQKVKELAKAYAELRTILRLLRVNDNRIIFKELNSEKEENDFLEDDQEELNIKTNSEVSFKDQILELIKNRISQAYVNMSFIPSIKFMNGELTDVDTLYLGKDEERIRAQEYASLMQSIGKQVEIINYEDIFRRTKEDNSLSPFVVGKLLDTIGDRASYKYSAEQCEKYVDKSMQFLDQFEEFPELRDTTKEVEYLGALNRYKLRMEDAAGYLNDNTSYSAFFKSLYDENKVVLCSGLTKEEISSRVEKRSQEYINNTEKDIGEIFSKYCKKYRVQRIKRDLKDMALLLFSKSMRATTITGRLFDKRQNGKNSCEKSSSKKRRRIKDHGNR